jgi:hypothetical protein
MKAVRSSRYRHGLCQHRTNLTQSPHAAADILPRTSTVMLAPRQVVQAGLQRVLVGTSSSINPVSAFLCSRRAPIGGLAAASATTAAAEGGSGDAPPAQAVAPPNIAKLAQMAQIEVTDKEVCLRVQRIATATVLLVRACERMRWAGEVCRVCVPNTACEALPLLLARAVGRPAPLR